MATVTNISVTSQSNETAAQGWLSAAVRLWGLILLALHLAAYSLPADLAWSLWPYTTLPTWAGWLLAMLAATLTLPPVSGAVWRALTRLWGGFAAMPVARYRQMWFAVAALLSGGLFWAARLRHLRWGDSYLLTVALSYPDLDLRVVYNWQAPFTVFLHQRLWQYVADPLLDWPVETVYATVSILCGMLFVFLLLNFAAGLGHSALEAFVLAGMVLTTGSMQLFFGYVENYTIISLLVMVMLFLGWRTAQGRQSLVWPAAALSLTNAFHPSTVFLWPGMLLLAWLCWRRGRLSLVATVAQLVLPPLLIGGSVLALMESGGHGLTAFLGVDRPGGGDGIWFVPLFETTTEWQHYTMFSVAHFLDWANIHLLISPFGIPVIVLVLLAAFYYKRPLFSLPAERDFARFLGLTAFMYILLTWLWNPDYGGQKDWDLFAPSALVYTLLAGYLLVKALPTRMMLKETSLFVLGVSLLHAAAWIFLNTHHLPHS